LGWLVVQATTSQMSLRYASKAQHALTTALSKM
jgi:hypothetical protein